MVECVFRYLNATWYSTLLLKILSDIFIPECDIFCVPKEYIMFDRSLPLTCIYLLDFLNVTIFNGNTEYVGIFSISLFENVNIIITLHAILIICHYIYITFHKDFLLHT